jgi:hypothetical protein
MALRRVIPVLIFVSPLFVVIARRGEWRPGPAPQAAGHAREVVRLGSQPCGLAKGLEHFAGDRGGEAHLPRGLAVDHQVLDHHLERPA